MKNKVGLSKFQWVCFIFVCGSNLIFIPALKQYTGYHDWGPFVFPHMHDVIKLRSFSLSTSDLIFLHAITAFCLLLVMSLQILLISFRLVSYKIHRWIGLFVLFFLLPLFFVIALCSTAYALKTPFNRVNFIMLPMLILYCQIKSYNFAKQKKIGLHVDYFLTSSIVLSSVAMYRLVLVFIHNALGAPMTVNSSPIDGAVIIVAIILILVLFCSAVSVRRIKENLVVPIVIFVVTSASMILLPWQFYGAPTRSRMIDNQIFQRFY